MQISKEFKVGILGIVSMVILYMGFNFLKGIDFFSRSSVYYALYDNIDGLTVSNPVIINGFTVGRVNEIKILHDHGNKILVELNLNSDIKVSRGTEARLISLDFLGSKAIEMVLGNNAREYYTSEDTLISSVDPGITDFLKESAGPVADDLSSAISSINEILESFKENSEKINETLQNILEITENINGELPVMEDKAKVLLDNFNQNSEELSSVMADLKPILQKADQFTDSLSTLELNKAFVQVQSNLENLNTSLERLNRGEGTMGKMMNDDSLYIYLSHTARDLDRLMVDLQAHPERYVQISVFGKKDKTEKKKKKEARDQ